MSPLHSYLILFIGDNARDNRNSTYHAVILQRPRNLSNHKYNYKRISIFCVIQKWYAFGSHVSDRPLFKGCVFGGPFPTQDIVVKTAPVHDSRAMSRLQREAGVYDALASLQGEVIPECLGYFTGTGSRCDSDVDEYIPSAALVTLHYGDTLMNEYEKGNRSREDLWEDMAGYYKRHIIGAVSEIHAKGFHLGHTVGAENIILDKWTDGSESGTDPFVVGLADAYRHKCTLHRMSTKHGELTPPRQEFGCDELYDLCSSLQIWFPRHIPYYNGIYRTKSFFPYPWLLAAKAPPQALREDALQEAFDAIIDYAERFAKDEGHALKGVFDEKRKEITEDFMAGKMPEGKEPYGIRSPLRVSLSFIPYLDGSYRTKSVFPYPWLLAAKAPPAVPREEAIQEAFSAILNYAEQFADDGGEELKRVFAVKREEIVEDFVANKVPEGDELYGIRPPLCGFKAKIERPALR